MHSNIKHGIAHVIAESEAEYQSEAEPTEDPIPCPDGRAIDPLHKSHNASDKYPTMHHFVTEMTGGLLDWVSFMNTVKSLI